MTSPSGVHHVALMTRDLKAQLDFFTDALGMPLVALYDMHGVPGAWHAFVRLDNTCYLAFAQVPGVEDVEPVIGLTHAGSGAGVSAAGTMQHLSFTVTSEDELLAVRDRLRSRGVNVFGPIDHGMCRSVYFAGPEGLALEAAWSAEPIDGRWWVDPTVAAAAGIDANDLERYRHPATFIPGPDRLPQPPIDPTKPHLHYDAETYAKMVATPDEVTTKYVSMPDPPVRPTA
jgi:catechol 2,3-dioxygenase-like lactoylglutathione lyase family enzyme